MGSGNPSQTFLKELKRMVGQLLMSRSVYLLHNLQLAEEDLLQVTSAGGTRLATTHTRAFSVVVLELWDFLP